MSPTYLTHLQFHLIGLIDDDLHREVSFDDVYSALSGDIIHWLKARFPKLDLSLFNDETSTALTNALDEISDINARRKFGVERNGICLLMALVNELIQRSKHDTQ